MNEAGERPREIPPALLPVCAPPSLWEKYDSSARLSEVPSSRDDEGSSANEEAFGVRLLDTTRWLPLRESDDGGMATAEEGTAPRRGTRELSSISSGCDASMMRSRTARCACAPLSANAIRSSAQSKRLVPTMDCRKISTCCMAANRDAPSRSQSLPNDSFGTGNDGNFFDNCQVRENRMNRKATRNEPMQTSNGKQIRSTLSCVCFWPLLAMRSIRRASCQSSNHQYCFEHARGMRHIRMCLRQSASPARHWRQLPL